MPHAGATQNKTVTVLDDPDPRPSESIAFALERARGNGVTSGAVFSENRRYRFLLWRIWDWDLPFLNVIGLNPSVANEVVLDPTCKRCEKRARRLGYGGYVMTNIHAIKSTDPKGLREVRDPTGRSFNNVALMFAATNAGLVLAAWGVDGALWNRGDEVKQMLTNCGVDLYCLGTTKGGHPKHPLYLRDDAVPELYARGAIVHEFPGRRSTRD